MTSGSSTLLKQNASLSLSRFFFFSDLEFRFFSICSRFLLFRLPLPLLDDVFHAFSSPSPFSIFFSSGLLPSKSVVSFSADSPLSTLLVLIKRVSISCSLGVV